MYPNGKCKTCAKAWQKAWHKTNPEKWRVWRKSNSEKVRAADRAWAKRNPLRSIYDGMLKRCKNPVGRNKGYAGVKVCRRWRKYSNWLADMGPRPSPKHSLSRLADVPLYSPKTTVWGTLKHQAEQRRIKRERMTA